MKRLRVIVWCAMMMAPASAAVAQTAAPAAGIPRAPDVVMLKDGSFFRGTISEKSPDGVEIVLISGKLRSFEIEEVSYAGARAGMPPAKKSEKGAEKSTQDGAAPAPAPDGDKDVIKPMVTVLAKEARLALRSDYDDELTFHRRVNGMDSELCTAPCEITIAAGTHTFAVSRGTGTVSDVDPMKIPAGDSTLQARIESKGGTRTVGWLVAVGGGIAGLAFIFTKGLGGDDGIDGGAMALGMGMTFGLPFLGLALAARSDIAHIDRSRGRPAQDEAQARGATVSGTF